MRDGNGGGYLMNERAQLGVDGNCGFALLGDNLQSGEAEFVEIDYKYRWPQNSGLRDAGKIILGSYAERIAAQKALDKLKARLGRDDLSFYFGPSHPFGD